MEELQDVFALIGVDEELINWDVVPEMTSRVVARALDAGDLGVIKLSTDELPSLIDICKGVRTKPPEGHPKRSNLKGHVEQEHEPQYKCRVNLHSEQIEKEPKIQNPFWDYSLINHNVSGAPFISVVEVCSIPIHYSIVISLRLKEEVHWCTDSRIYLRVLFFAPIFIWIVRTYKSNERRSDPDTVVLWALPDFVQYFVE